MQNVAYYSASGKPWGAVEAAHRLTKNKVPDWTPDDLVPIKPPSIEVTVYKILKWVVPALLAAISLWVLGLSWWLLAAALLVRKTFKYLSSVVHLTQRDKYLAELNRTHDVYRQVVAVQEELGLSHPREVTPFMVKKLSERYELEFKDRQRDYKERRLAKALNCYKPGNAIYDRDQRTGWAKDDARFNYGVSNSSSSHVQGRSAPQSFGGWYDSDDDSGHSSFNDYPMGHVNPANGMPMMPGGVMDVTNHVYGTND